MRKQYEIKDNKTNETIYSSKYFGCVARYFVEKGLYRTTYITNYGVRI